MCAHCGKSVAGDAQTIDHIIPKSKGGTDDQRNLMPLCKFCNKHRGTNKIEVSEFYPFATQWALDDFRDYLFAWKMERMNGEGDIFVDVNQWIF